MTQRRWFPWALAVTCLVALVARLTYIVRTARHLPLVGDAETYHLLGRVLAAGDGYVRPRELLATGLAVATAEFPPMHPFILALADLVGLDSPTSQRVLGACLGVVTVALVGLLGRRIAGDRAGIVAAALAALSPVLIEHDASLQAEGLYMLLVAASLLTIHVAMHRRSHWYDLVLLGLLLGATSLTRSEAVLLVPVAAALIAWTGGRPSLRHLLAVLALLAVGVAAVLGSWAVRSSVALGGVVVTSTNAGTLLAGGNCDPVYGGPQRGLWLLACVRAVDTTGLDDDELARTRRWTAAGLDYATDHVTEVPAVAAVRVLRTWGLWDPDGQVSWETLEGRSHRWHTLAHRAHVLVLAAAIGGFVVLRRRPRDLVLLLTPVAASVLVSLASVGNTRFRAGADVVLIVAAGAAVDALWRRWRPDELSPGVMRGPPGVPDRSPS